VKVSSLLSYVGKRAKITLSNTRWYECTILSVSDTEVKFLDRRGISIIAHPDSIVILEPLEVERG
jgi:hypothetical protein